MKILAKIKGLSFIVQIALFLACYVILVYLGRKRVYTFRKWISKTILKMYGITINVTGSIDANAQLLIINHQSLLDIMILEQIHDKKLSWVAKKELFTISFYGRVLHKTADIALDRGNKKGLLKLIKQVKNRIYKGFVVAIFPEGTRSTKGTLLRFKPGTEFVANNLALTVQPIVISNSLRLFNMKAYELYAGELKVTIMPSFNTVTLENKHWLAPLREDMLKVYNAKS